MKVLDKCICNITKTLQKNKKTVKEKEIIELLKFHVINKKNSIENVNLLYTEIKMSIVKKIKLLYNKIKVSRIK